MDASQLAGLGVGGVIAGIMLLWVRELIAQHKQDMKDLVAAGAAREERATKALENNAAANAQLVPALTSLVGAVAELIKRLPQPEQS